MVDRKGQQTKLITMTSMTARRAGAAIAGPVEVVDGLLEPYRTTVKAGAFDKSRLVSINVVNGPSTELAVLLDPLIDD